MRRFAAGAAHSTVAERGARLHFGLFVALALHLILVLGVVFDLPESGASAANLDVTLVTHRAERSPQQADFIAQADQRASGTLDELAVPTSIQPPSRAPDIPAPPADGRPHAPVAPPAGEQASAVLARRMPAAESLPDRQGVAAEAVPAHPPTGGEYALLHRLDTTEQTAAKQPRVGVLSAVAARARADAAYQAHLQERVVLVGNQHYPRESIERGIFGSLSLRLTVLPDGTLESTEITRSSGHALLDRAAVKIARQAAPFAPFPADLAAKYDKVVFIRHWQFLPGGDLATGL